MKKEDLRKLRKLYATDAMMRKAAMDIPKTEYYRNCRTSYEKI